MFKGGFRQAVSVCVNQYNQYSLLMAYDAIRPVLIITPLCGERPHGTVDFILKSDDLIPDYTDTSN